MESKELKGHSWITRVAKSARTAWNNDSYSENSSHHPGSWTPGETHCTVKLVTLQFLRKVFLMHCWRSTVFLQILVWKWRIEGKNKVELHLKIMAKLLRSSNQSVSNASTMWQEHLRAPLLTILISSVLQNNCETLNSFEGSLTDADIIFLFCIHFWSSYIGNKPSYFQQKRSS